MNETVLAPSQTPSQRPLAPFFIILGLGAVVVANAIMITIAVSNPSLPAAQDHWAESLSWDRELAQRERSAALGWSLAGLGWSDAGRERLGLDLVDGEGRALTGLRGSLALERADTLAHDRRLELRELGGGRYLVEALDQGQGQSYGQVIGARGLVRLTLDVQALGGERFVTRQAVDLATLELLGPMPMPMPSPEQRGPR